jgi:hypothetical protein
MMSTNEWFCIEEYIWQDKHWKYNGQEGNEYYLVQHYLIAPSQEKVD